MTPESKDHLTSWLALGAGLLLVIVLIVSVTKAQDSQLSETQRLRLTVQVQKLILSQTQWQQAGCADMGTKLNANSAEWTKTQSDVAKELKLPEGTTFKVKDLDRMIYEVVPPPPTVKTDSFPSQTKEKK